MKDCTTCKYGYKDERLGIPMCHHPKRFSDDCVDFNMHEEKEIKEPEKPVPNDLEEAASRFSQNASNEHNRHYLRIGFIFGAKWDREQMMNETVEGEITKDNRGNNVVRTGALNNGFEIGDKVRIIIVKEEN